MLFLSRKYNGVTKLRILFEKTIIFGHLLPDNILLAKGNIFNESTNIMPKSIKAKRRSRV